MTQEQADYGLQKRQPLDIDLSKGVLPQNYGELLQFAKLYQTSGLAPKSLQTVEQVAIAIGMCMELGRPVLTGLQDMAVINGKVGIYGDAALAQVRSSGQLEYIKETEEGAPYTDNWTFRCEIKRKGSPEPRVGIWTWVDSKRAGFDKPKTKDGRDDIWSPWIRFTRRMMQFKARNFVMRDEFGDVLKGLSTVEEIQDYIDVTPDKPKPNGLPKTEGNGATYEFKTEKAEKEPEPPPAGAPGPNVGPGAPMKQVVQEGGPLVPGTITDPPQKVYDLAAILSAIKLASKVKGQRGKDGIRFLYKKERNGILSLAGTNLDYAKTVYESAGLDWSEFAQERAPNPAQDQRSPEDEYNGPPWDENEQGHPEQQAEPSKNGPETTTNYNFLKVMGEIKKQIGEEVYRVILGRHGYEHANEVVKREHQEAIYRAMQDELKEQQEEAAPGPENG